MEAAALRRSNGTPAEAALPPEQLATHTESDPQMHSTEKIDGSTAVAVRPWCCTVSYFDENRWCPATLAPGEPTLLTCCTALFLFVFLFLFNAHVAGERGWPHTCCQYLTCRLFVGTVCVCVCVCVVLVGVGAAVLNVEC